MRTPLGLVLAVLLLAGCRGADDASNVACSDALPTVSKLVGPEGGTIELAGGAKVNIPAGALTESTTIKVSQVDSIERLPDNLEAAGKAYAFEPHGQVFNMPVAVNLPFTGDTTEVRPMKLEDENDTTWQTIVGSTKDETNEKLEVQTTTFSVYQPARPARGSGVITLPDGAVIDAGMPDAMIPPDPAAGLQGEHVVDVYDSGSRSVYKQVIFDGTHLFWTRDADGMFAIFSADVTASLPVTGAVLFEAPWAAASGWSNPPLLATSEHLVFPLIGVVDMAGVLTDATGWATMRKDGSEFTLDVLDNWWLVARGPDVLKRSFDAVVNLVSLTAGAETPFQNFPDPQGNGICVYDAVADEAGCLNSRITAYSFGASTSQIISESPSLYSSANGLSFNSTHWFASVTLPSGLGIGAFARDASGVTYYEDVDALGEFAVDDAFLYACLAGVLTRVPLGAGARTVLSEDCGEAAGISILGADATYLYYVHQSKLDAGYPQIPVFQRQPLQIYRVAKDG